MRKLGAIPFCLTNIPQTMVSYACSNPIFGITTHPLDKDRTPGGSSGGEACLIAMGGSILGNLESTNCRFKLIIESVRKLSRKLC